MARERRIEYAGAIYHVMARGDRREDIVLDDDDRLRFEETLQEVVEKNGWVTKRLFMGAPGAVSRAIREARELVMEDRKVRSQQRKIEKMSIPSD